MDRSVSVEDFVSGLLHGGHNPSSTRPRMGLGRRSESEAAFQEFLKRIPSATALSSQNAEDNKGAILASASNTSLFGFGSSNLEANGVPRVASLEMLRSIVDHEADKDFNGHRVTGSGLQQTHHPDSFRPPNTQLFQPSGQTMPHPSHSIGGEASCAPGNMPIASSMPPGISNLALQVPGNLLSYQNLQLGTSPQLMPGMQSAVPVGMGPVGVKMPQQPQQQPEQHPAEDSDKIEQRKARRMLSNRESARRSRKRKQEQLQELESQIKILTEKNENLEQQCQAAADHVVAITAEKQRLENENHHLNSILQSLQKSLGAQELKKHLPPALGGVGPIPPAASPNALSTGGVKTEPKLEGADGADASEEAKVSPAAGRGLKRSARIASSKDDTPSQRAKLEGEESDQETKEELV